MTTAQMHVGVVDAVALRRFNEPTMIKVVAARMRREAGEYKVSRKIVRPVVEAIAGTRSLGRLRKAIIAEIDRQDEVEEARKGQRDDIEDPCYYDPVHALTTSDHFTFEEGDYYSEGEEGRLKLLRLDRMTALFDHRVPSKTWDAALDAIGMNSARVSASREVRDARIFAGNLVALVEPGWITNKKGKSRTTGLPRFLAVMPRRSSRGTGAPRGKALLVPVAPAVTSVAEGLASLMPKAATEAVNRITGGLAYAPSPYLRVELDWKRRRCIVWRNGVSKAHPFRKIGITPDGAERLKWVTIDDKTGAWLRVLSEPKGR